jgi:hypothetical protein
MERNRNPQHGIENASDMELLFGPVASSNVDRGAQVRSSADLYQIQSNKDLKQDAGFEKQIEVNQPKLENALDFSPVSQLDDLNFAIRYVLFDKALQQDVFDHTVDFVQQFQADAPNYTVRHEDQKVFGYLFEDSKFAGYCLQLFRHADTYGLSCDLHDGFAPVLNPFWKELRAYLMDAQLISPDDDEMEEDEDDDLDFLDSDSEDVDGFILDLSVPSAKYLNLEDDTTVIDNWVEDIKDPNFSQETLLSLSYNCKSENNLQILADNYAQDLFDAVIASMSSMSGEALPSVRSACVFLAELGKFSNVNVTEENIKVLINQLAKWTLAQNVSAEAMRSKEVATLLSKCILPKFSELVSGVLKNIQTDVLETIRNETDFDEVKYYVDQYRQQYAQPVR